MIEAETGRRVTLVTGAGKGLGRAFALACAARGDFVVVNNRLRAGAPDSAQQVAQEITDLGGEAVAQTSDILDQDAADAMTDTALQTWGRLDAVVFNAGVNGSAGRFLDTDESEFETVLATNFTAQIRLARRALPDIRRSPAGRLVFVASSAGLYGIAGRAPYSASKAALTAFALALAHEEQRGTTRVNVLAPYADTRMTQGAFEGAAADRFTPENAAAPCAWLASPDCARNGDIWIAGGGYTRRAAMMEGGGAALPAIPRSQEIGRASCRERV
jgi:NAD(P)-dependent dehydrogenase (short-subunit alcohol dehydrogenase family)